MNRFSLIYCLFIGLAASSSLTLREAAAGDWRFRRSYFSHQLSPEWYGSNDLPRSRSAYRAAYPNLLPGFSVQGGYRINRIQINSGTSSDTTYLREGWFQLQR